MSWVLLGAGMVTIAAAMFEAPFLMDSWKGRMLTRNFGKNGARAFFGILGLAAMFAGLLMGRGVL